MATWETGYRRVKSMRPYPDEEIVCVTMNWWSPPSKIAALFDSSWARMAVSAASEVMDSVMCRYQAS